MPSWPTSATGITTLFLAACGVDGGSQGGWEGTVSDSSGVEVVTNDAAGVWNGDGWSLEMEILFGSIQDRSEHQFAQITGVAETGAGRILVTDLGARAVQLYEPTGTLVADLGGPGAGPGELSPQAGPALVARGDTIVVPDLGNGRVSTFSPAGDFVSSTPLDPTRGLPFGWVSTVEGTVVTHLRDLSDPAARDVLVEWSPQTGRGRDLATLTRGESYDFVDGATTIRLFAREPAWAVLDDGSLATGTNDTFRIEVRDGSGTLRRLVRHNGSAQPVTPTDIGLFRDGIRGYWVAAGMDPTTAGQMSEALDVAPDYPAFWRMLGGPEGSIWVQRVRDVQELSSDQRKAFDPLIDLGSNAWDVFGGDGRLMGTIDMPHGFQAFTYRNDRFWGVWRDDLDVQHVAAVRVVRG